MLNRLLGGGGLDALPLHTYIFFTQQEHSFISFRVKVSIEHSLADCVQKRLVRLNAEIQVFCVSHSQREDMFVFNLPVYFLACILKGHNNAHHILE